MKKISTLLTAALAFGLSAYAVEPEVIQLKNPSFEEADESVTECPQLAGWSIMGSDSYAVKEGETEPSATYLYATQSRPKSWSDGSYGIRSGAAVNLTGANYIYQTLTSQKPGVYVLQFDGRTARSNWKNGLNIYKYDEEGNIESTINTFYDMAFLYDNYGGIEGVEAGTTPDDEGTTILWSNGHPHSKGWWNSDWPRYFLIHKTAPETFDDGETDIAFGFGFPESNQVNEAGETVYLSKAQIACENFILRYFDTEDIEVAKAWVNAEIAKIEAGDYSLPALPSDPQEIKIDNPDAVKQPMHVANGTAFNIPIGTFVTNSGWGASTGINDIAAPAVKGDNKYYNLQGIEIAKPTQAGLYIHNGKKYIVR